MSDTFDPAPGSSPLSEQPPNSQTFSPWLLGCGALLLALVATGILGVVMYVVIAARVKVEPARNRRRPPVALQPRRPRGPYPVSPNRSSRSPRSAAQRLAQSQQAIESGTRALTASPNNAGALNGLAWAYATAPEELRDGDQAVVLAEQAVALDRQNRNYVNTLGTAYYRAGQYDEAVSTLHRNAGERTDTRVCFDLFPLAMAYLKLEQTDKAKETYERACKLLRRPDRLSSTQWHELHEFRAEAATLFLGEPPKQAFTRAAALARGGEWEQAADLFAKGLDVAPDDHWQWYRSGALQAYLEHPDEYQNHCRKMLELFGDTQDPFIAERTGKLCLILPDAVPDDPRPAQLLAKAVGMRPDVSWFLLASAIAKYRAGQFQEALVGLESAEAQAQSGEDLYCNLMIGLVRAMSQHQLEENDAAQISLNKTIDQLKSTAPKAEDDVV